MRWPQLDLQAIVVVEARRFDDAANLQAVDAGFCSLEGWAELGRPGNGLEAIVVRSGVAVLRHLEMVLQLVQQPLVIERCPWMSADLQDAFKISIGKIARYEYFEH